MRLMVLITMILYIELELKYPELELELKLIVSSGIGVGIEKTELTPTLEPSYGNFKIWLTFWPRGLIVDLWPQKH